MSLVFASFAPCLLVQRMRQGLREIQRSHDAPSGALGRITLIAIRVSRPIEIERLVGVFLSSDGPVKVCLFTTPQLHHLCCWQYITNLSHHHNIIRIVDIFPYLCLKTNHCLKRSRLRTSSACLATTAGVINWKKHALISILPLVLSLDKTVCAERTNTGSSALHAREARLVRVGPSRRGASHILGKRPHEFLLILHSHLSC